VLRERVAALPTAVGKDGAASIGAAAPTDRWTHVIRRYLATRAFASWMAYQGSGVDAVLKSLELTLLVLRHEIDRHQRAMDAELSASGLKECIRSTDLLLVHRADRNALARALSEGSAAAVAARLDHVMA
jgi:hypothetical protein